MRTKTNRIIVFDLEATCWKDGNQDKKQELIEIGWCSLYNDEWTIRSKFNILIKPEKELSDYCTELTGISNEMLKESGIKLDDALRRFSNLVSRHSMVASWGDWDYKFLKELYRERDIPFPLSGRFIDIKSLSSFAFGEKKGVGLQSMKNKRELSGLNFDQTVHRALPDAYNEALILREVLRM